MLSKMKTHWYNFCFRNQLFSPSGSISNVGKQTEIHWIKVPFYDRYHYELLFEDFLTIAHEKTFFD
jgi:hypothetical protein